MDDLFIERMWGGLTRQIVIWIAALYFALLYFVYQKDWRDSFTKNIGFALAICTIFFTGWFVSWINFLGPRFFEMQLNLNQSLTNRAEAAERLPYVVATFGISLTLLLVLLYLLAKKGGDKSPTNGTQQGLGKSRRVLALPVK